jgi:DNA (cytosine-5)-methyltransferase 1
VGNTKELRTLSLCTGYGGIERGLELAGEQLRTVAHVEIEAYAIANLVAKMEEGKLAPAPIWTDLKTLPLEPFRGAVDLLTGGYPCQPFSAAGRRRGEDDPRHLWPWICRIIDGVMPRMCFFENVEGHISLGLRQVLADLEARGYRTSWGIFSASEVGAPHQRKRVFIMADSRRSPERAKSIRQGGSLNDVSDSGQLGAEKRAGSGECSEVANATSEGLERPTRESLQGRIQGSTSAGRNAGEHEWPARPNERQFESELGRTTNGTPNRVDRLRLLGNGVVPQTAAKAWRVLNEDR